MRFVAQECELDGVRLPVGTVVILSQWVMHRAPEIWPDAEVFKPERWDPANERQLPPETGDHAAPQKAFARDALARLYQ